MPVDTSQISSQINSLIGQFQEIVNCDPVCQQKKELAKLKEKYELSKSNLESAPARVEVAHKNYVTYSEGENAWNDLYEKQLKEEVEKKSDEFLKKQEEHKKNIQLKISSYDSILLNYKNVVDLYLKYKKENEMLVKELRNTSNDLLTNERKTYYQDQQSDILKYYYYYIILTIYIICVVFFGFISLIYPSQTSWKIRLFIFILLILLPFISTRLLGIFIYIIHEIYYMFPKNVYKEDIDDTLGINKYKNMV